jgi:hypothetical protein
MRRVSGPPAVAALAAAALVSGCANDSATTRPTSAVELDRAEQVTRKYLDAAARGDRARLCALRTEGALSRWGGEASVWVDAGKTRLENGRAVGGEILAFELKREDAGYRIARVGFASFPD